MITAESKQSTEVWVVPAADPTATPRSVAGRRADHEYSVDHWGDRFVDRHQRRRRGLPRRDRADRRTRRSGPSSSPTSRDGGSPRSRRSPGTSSSTSGRTPSPACGSCSATARERVVGHRRRAAATSSSTPTRSTTPRRCATRYQSLDDAGVGVRDDVTHRRAPAAQADAGARASTSSQYESAREWAPAPDGTQVPVDVVRRRDTPRRRHRAGVALRLRRLRVLDAAVVLRRPAVAARPRRACGRSPTRAAAASSAGAGTSTASC